MSPARMITLAGLGVVGTFVCVFFFFFFSKNPFLV